MTTIILFILETEFHSSSFLVRWPNLPLYALDNQSIDLQCRRVIYRIKHFIVDKIVRLLHWNFIVTYQSIAPLLLIFLEHYETAILQVLDTFFSYNFQHNPCQMIVSTTLVHNLLS